MKTVGSVKRDRVNRMYVDRKITVNRITTVDPVDPIKPVHNHTSHVNENFMLLAGAFYDNFSLLKGHFKKFYQHQQELERLFEKVPEEDDGSVEKMIQLISELIVKYNCALRSLKQLESSLANQNQSQRLYEVLSHYQLQLGKIGITILGDQSLSFNPSIFKNNLTYNQDYLTFLFDYQQGLVKKLFTLFKNIKASTLKLLPTYDQNQSQPIAGILLDQKY